MRPLNDEEGATINLRASSIAPYPRQPRTYFDPEVLRKLGESMGVLQEEPIKVVALDTHPFLRELLPAGSRFGRYTHMICNGESRWRAFSAKNPHGYLEVREITVKSEQELYERSLRSNRYGQEHSMLEMIRAVERCFVEYRMGREEIGEAMNLRPATVDEYFELSQLDPQVLDLMDPALPEAERIRTKSTAQVLLTVHPSKQHEAAMALIHEHVADTRGAEQLVAARFDAHPRERSAGKRQVPKRPRDALRALSGDISIAAGRIRNAHRIPLLDHVLRAAPGDTKESLAKRLGDLEEEVGKLKDKVHKLKERVEEADRQDVLRTLDARQAEGAVAG